MRLSTLLLLAISFSPALSQAMIINYAGSWNNTTFSSSGDASLVINTDPGSPGVWQYTADLDGSVFGLLDPAPLIFSTPDPTVTTSFAGTFTDAFYGTAAINFNFGALDVKMTSLPAPANNFILQTELFGTAVPGSPSINLDYIVWFIGSTPNAGIAGNTESLDYAKGNIQLALTAPVPLPASFMLLLSALLSLRVLFKHQRH